MLARFKKKLFANCSLQKFVVAICVVNIALEIGIGLDYIGIVSNWQSYFCQTSIFLNNFRTWNNGHSCHFYSIQYIFQRANRKCLTKKNYRSKIPLCVIKVILGDQSYPISRRTCTSCAVACFLFLPLAKLQIFITIILFRRRNSSMYVKTLRCLSVMRLHFQDACIACSHATLLRDPSTRNIPS